jgi:hypothetical protein
VGTKFVPFVEKHNGSVKFCESKEMSRWRFEFQNWTKYFRKDASQNCITLFIFFVYKIKNYVCNGKNKIQNKQNYVT